MLWSVTHFKESEIVLHDLEGYKSDDKKIVIVDVPLLFESKFDEVVEDNGVQIVVDAKAVLFILGSVIDYEVDVLSSRFTFTNPNQTDACGCGESVTIIPAPAL